MREFGAISLPNSEVSVVPGSLAVVIAMEVLQVVVLKRKGKKSLGVGDDVPSGQGSCTCPARGGLRPEAAPRLTCCCSLSFSGL